MRQYMNVKTPSCLLCGCLATEHFLDVSDHVTSRWFTLRRCAKCDLVFTAPIPEILDEFYPKSYRDYHPLLLIILGAIHRRRIRSWARTSGSALEIGCGHGFMLAGLRDMGWAVAGMNPRQIHQPNLLWASVKSCKLQTNLNLTNQLSCVSSLYQILKQR